MDGLVTGIKWIDDIEWFGRTVYLSHEIDIVNDPGSEFVALTDGNGDGDAMDPGEINVQGRTAATDDPTVAGITVIPAGNLPPTCVNTAMDRDADYSSLGGTVNYRLKDIPVALRTPTSVGFGLLSLAGDLPFRLPGGCIIGFFPDPLSVSLVMTTGVISGETAALSPPILHPPGLPVGIDIYSVGVVVDAATFTYSGITGTGVSTIQ